MYRCRQLFGGQAEGIGARGSILLSSSQEMVLATLSWFENLLDWNNLSKMNCATTIQGGWRLLYCFLFGRRG
jgi:hypothetical protein